MEVATAPELVEATPLEGFLEDAARLADHLGEYQRCLAFITNCSREDSRRRILALASLAEPIERRRDEVCQLAYITHGALKEMASIGLLRIDGHYCRLRRLGESFLGLMFLFNKDVQGGSSEGFVDLIQAANSGGYGTVFMARLLNGSLMRQSHRLDRVTDTEDADALAGLRSERDLAHDRIERAIDALGRDLPYDVSEQLRISANALNLSSVGQKSIAARISREDVVLPQGKRYNDVTRLLSRHTSQGFLDMLDESPALFQGVVKRIQKANLTEAVKHVFEPVDAPESEEVPTQRPVQGDIPRRRADIALLADIEAAHEGQALHEIATSPPSYFRGVWFAVRGRVPGELRKRGIHFELTDQRIQEPPYLDVPLILIRRQHAP